MTETVSLVEQQPYTTLFYALVIGWGTLNARLHRRGRDESVERESSGSRWKLGVVIGGSFLVAVVVYERVPQAAMAVPAVAFWGGVVLLVVGAIVREAAIRTLGGYFTLDLAATDDQPVVDTGPYAWVRHPSYTGAVLSFVGIGLTLANWLSLVVTAVGVVIAYGYRIRVEEGLLREEIGAAYEAYTERTPYRLVPGVW